MSSKRTFVVLAIACATALATFDFAEARRLGGGKSVGVQRSTPTAPANNPNNGQAVPPTPAQPAPQAPAANPGATAAAPAAATAAAAAPARRSWLGPVAGIAAGLGLAALMSHLGLADEFASLLLLGLLAVVVAVALRWFLARRAGAARPAFAGAGAGAGAAGAAMRFQADDARAPAAPAPLIGSRLGTPLAVPGVTDGPRLPPDFDAEGFARIAKAIFVRLQAAGDTADVDELRRFTTPELFAALKVDLLERGPAAQHTDVLALDAQVVGVAAEDGQEIVSVAYRGRVREEPGAEPVEIEEVWHLVRPQGGADGGWRIAGIQQVAPAA